MARPTPGRQLIDFMGGKGTVKDKATFNSPIDICFHNDMAEYWNSPVFKIINHLKRDKSQRDRKERDERRMKEMAQGDGS